MLAHEIAEQTAKQTNSMGKDRDHEFGISAENAVSGFTRGPGMTGTFDASLTGSVTVPYSIGNRTVPITFQWVNGNLIKVVRP